MLRCCCNPLLPPALTCPSLPPADIQLVVVGSGGNALASYKLGKVLLSTAWLNPVGGRLTINQLQEGTHP